MNTLPIPGHFDSSQILNDPSVFTRRVEYALLETSGLDWRRKHNLSPAASDRTKIALMGIDQQNTFCTPGFELFVGGKSGVGAVEDSIRFCEFVYRNLGVITKVFLTMDTHTRMQIFHPSYWIDEKGNHPAPIATIITQDDVLDGKWRVDPAVAANVANGNYVGLQRMAEHYVKTLTQDGKYPLIIWPYHAMLGGIGHAIVSSIEEAAFFHNICRSSQTGFEIKGGNPVTENYSVLRPEVLTGPDGTPIAQKNTRFLQTLLSHDYVVIAGQAASHCVAWTIQDLLDEITMLDPDLARKVYIMEDCSSPVVVPGIVDFSGQAQDALNKFKAAGMHVVKSTNPIESWPGMQL